MTCVEAEKMVVPYMKDELSPTELEDFLDISIPVRTAGRSWRSTIWWMWV